MIVVVMGVSGCGKSTIGVLLAEHFHVPFYDADDYHPPSNVTKMRAAAPLADEDRRPWLRTLAEEISRWNDSGGAVLACSALKASYRDVLRTGRDELVFVFLEGTKELFESRMRTRTGHFFPVDLIESQLTDLEPPSDAIRVDAARSPEEIVDSIVNELRSDSVKYRM